MTQTDHWTEQAIKHIRVLSKSIGPRSAASDEEERAARYVRDELRRHKFKHVRLERFHGAVSIWLPYAMALSMTAWGLLIGFMFGLVGSIIASALYLLATWTIYYQLYPAIKSSPVQRRLWHRESRNVLGVVAPSGPVERRVVLMANLDSARSPFFWRSRRRRQLAGRMMRPLFLSLPLSAAAFFLGAVTTNAAFYMVALLLAIPQTAALFTSLFAERSPHNPGANNNGSGVGTLLALAERLTKAPLTRTEVWVLATGCRETGGDGARAFLEAHAEALRDAIFVALEGVGVGERTVYLSGEGALHQTSYPSAALALASRTASGGITGARHRGAPTEMGLIVREGFAGIIVNTWPDDWPGVANRRRLDDTLDSIEQEALGRAHAFAWALLQEIDTRLENSP